MLKGRDAIRTALLEKSKMANKQNINHLWIPMATASPDHSRYSIA